MIDINKCPDEFNTNEHATMRIPEGIDRKFRCWNVLMLTSPGEPDFKKYCDIYQVTEAEVIQQHLMN